MTDPAIPSDAQAIIAAIRELSGAHRVVLADTDLDALGQYAVLPAGQRLQSLKPIIDEFRAEPERRKGTAQLGDLDSFIAYLNRFSAPDRSVVFARNTRTAPRLVGVVDYHEAGHDGAPAFAEHRAAYDFPLSEEWQAWHAKNGEKMSQAEFADFLEDRIADVIAPPPPEDIEVGDGLAPTPDPLAELRRAFGGDTASPTRLIELSRGLAVNAGEQVKQAVNLQSGEASIVYSSEHRDGAGEKLQIPSHFLIAVPVFVAGARYRIAVRLRYRLTGGALAWFFKLHRTDVVFDHAFDEAVAKVRLGTCLPVFLGEPEK
jgi:uncharacterized protein YfdQ (DUF2303 family)